MAINSKLKSVHYLLFRQQSFARRITTDRWYPSFPSFWLSWCGIGLLSVHNLCSVCFHNFSGFGIREREGENIFPSINQSIYCLKLLFPEQTNSFVCDTYFSTKLDYIQYFFLYFFSTQGIFCIIGTGQWIYLQWYSQQSGNEKTLHLISVVFFLQAAGGNCLLIITSKKNPIQVVYRSVLSFTVLLVFNDRVVQYYCFPARTKPCYRVLTNAELIWVITEREEKRERANMVIQSHSSPVIFTE